VNEFAKTGVFVGGAALLALLAAVVGPKSQRHELALDEGQAFFPEFKDPAAATELTVVQFEEATSRILSFQVKKDDKGLWAIPSHGGYPADATSRMSKAATMFLGLTKGRIAGDRNDEHGKFGVLEPGDQGSVDTKGRGVRVTLKDKTGNTLSDVIVGKEVDGKFDQRYVRVPGKRHVYVSKLTGDLSTKFADWIETDLLKVTAWDTKQIVFDNYKFDPATRETTPGDKLTVAKDEQAKWTLAGLDAEKEDPNEEALREIANSLSQIKIVGVRRKPDGLTADFKLAQGADANEVMRSLLEAGYFPSRRGVVSNEGELLVETQKGLRYTLRFGDLAYGEGDEVTAGIKTAAPQPKDGETGPVAKTANNRFLMVSIQFDENLLQKPTGLRLPKEQLDKRKTAREAITKIVAAVDAYKAKHQSLPESLAKLAEKPAESEALLAKLEADPWGGEYRLQAAGEGFTVLSLGADQKDGGEGEATDVRSDQFAAEEEWQRLATEWTEYDRKVEDGKKEAEKLTRRFGPWYYVIDQALFSKLKPQRKDLVKAKAVTPADGEGKSDQPKDGGR
jgi:hypothetical protein